MSLKSAITVRTLFVLVASLCFLVLVNFFTISSHLFLYARIISSYIQVQHRSNATSGESEYIQWLQEKSRARKANVQHARKNVSLHARGKWKVYSATYAKDDKNKSEIASNAQHNLIVSRNDRQDSCDNCFAHKFDYVIFSDSICKVIEGKAVELVIFIMTAHENNEQRNAIRQTWLTISKNNTANVRYAFILGETKDKSLREKIMLENSVHKDFLMENFIDSYSNLTLKTIMSFKYAANNCPNVKFVMKTDDDMYVNVPFLLELLRKHEKALQKAVGGSCTQKASPIRVQTSKWYASYQSFPHKYYPGFCSGTGYVTSLNVVRKVYEVSPNIPFFHLEDVYMSLCINTIGYKLLGLQGFNTGRPKLDPCLYKSFKLITSHGLSAHMQKSIWNGICSIF
ncbi:hypothetical protein CHS0354_042333 [Potamilus streckersoni]|uniref:Hexosyltransferase n=1 Tax=Potamilus streckersoni TaxID=2493646 RepID=A0AAE0STK6_9BIVA|nr:hypothetical protein CHS0354_042333 [Potamilus streckersoni]